MKRPLVFSKLKMPEGSKEVEKEIRLWRSVLDQALQDFEHEVITEDDIKVKENAKIWLVGDTQDFKDVCDLAMVSPEKARIAINNYLEEENDGSNT